MTNLPAATLDGAVETMPSVAEIFGPRLAPAPWPPSRPVLDLAIEVLPIVSDDVAADLLEQMAVTVADQRDELRALRATLSRALAHAHQQHLEILRFEQRLGDLRDELRRSRAAS